ncbi:hypothetical protein [Spirosoma pollinicola]|uniref:Uncharacterized protein n=1 Tax=Spirosoma pollinicola TaxID=2057025 RepID=A0A2K8YUY4_9BACT|nr:hypothetical protein [Spirosoma pollinicola]AUD01442.1 hypothetical protein CWM47_06230 [Spirosoma pollinicola]
MASLDVDQQMLRDVIKISAEARSKAWAILELVGELPNLESWGLRDMHQQIHRLYAADRLVFKGLYRSPRSSSSPSERKQ